MIENLLAFDAGDFFSSWYGVLILTVLYATAAVLLIVLAYRPFFKSFFDFLAGLVASVVTLPVALVIIIVSCVHIIKTNEYASVFSVHKVAGKNGRRVGLHSFTVTANLTGELTKLGGFLRRTGLEKLPLVYDLLLLRISLVGVKPLSLTDEKFVSEGDYERFAAKPGIFNPLLAYDRAEEGELSYEEMFDSDRQYVEKTGVFKDISILFTALLRKIRGEKGDIFGETAQCEYCDALLARGEIDRALYDEARAESREEEEEEESEAEESPDEDDEEEETDDEEE